MSEEVSSALATHTNYNEHAAGADGSSSVLNENKYAIICTIQICTGSISLLASMAMATSIQFSKRKLSTPYRRLVYGLCVSDILQSISLTVGPFAPPSETPHAFWARGNTATCDLNGFMLNIGVTAAPMYILALGVYYLCKLKRRMPDEVFRVKYEFWIHRFIILWHLIINIILVLTRNFNPAFSGSCCLLTEFPYRCNKTSLLEDNTIAARSSARSSCERGSNSRFMSYLSFVAPLVICFVCICCCMFQLLQHAFSMLKMSPPATTISSCANEDQKQSRMMNHHPQQQEEGEEREEDTCNSLHREIHDENENRSMLAGLADRNEDANSIIEATNDDCDRRSNQHNNENISSRVSSSNDTSNNARMSVESAAKSASVHAVHDLSITYRKEMITQALSFIGVFFLVYFIPFVRWFYVITETPLPYELIVALVVIYPLGGLFYILVHNRTNAAGLKRREPRISWCVAFTKVFLNGGDIPMDCDGYCDQDEQKRKRDSLAVAEEDGDMIHSEQYDSDGQYSLDNFIDSEKNHHSSSEERETQSHGSYLISQQQDDSFAMEMMSMDNRFSNESSYAIDSLRNRQSSHKEMIL